MEAPSQAGPSLGLCDPFLRISALRVFSPRSWEQAARFLPPGGVSLYFSPQEQGGQSFPEARLLAPQPGPGPAQSLDSEASLCGQLLAGRVQRAWGACSVWRSWLG